MQIQLLEIHLTDPEGFLKVKETLTRIGVTAVREKRLFQSCHILHKQGRFYIVHFKEMFILDGRPSTLTEQDIARRNTICALLQEWGLVRVVNPNWFATAPKLPVESLKILPFKQKGEWILEAKYTIGKKR